MTYILKKVNKLTEKELHILDVLISCNFNKTMCYDTLYPEKILTTLPTVKTRYFEYLFTQKKEVTLNYIDGYYKNKYKSLFLSKERILTELMDLIQLCKTSGDYQSALKGYKQLADLMGLNILKSQIDINQTSLVLHYHQPTEIDNGVEIKMIDEG